MLSLVFLIAALIVFLGAAVNVPVGLGRISLTPVGLACWVASELVERL